MSNQAVPMPGEATDTTAVPAAPTRKIPVRTPGTGVLNRSKLQRLGQPQLAKPQPAKTSSGVIPVRTKTTGVLPRFKKTKVLDTSRNSRVNSGALGKSKLPAKWQAKWNAFGKPKTSSVKTAGTKAAVTQRPGGSLPEGYAAGFGSPSKKKATPPGDRFSPRRRERPARFAPESATPPKAIPRPIETRGQANAREQAAIIAVRGRMPPEAAELNRQSAPAAAPSTAGKITRKDAGNFRKSVASSVNRAMPALEKRHYNTKLKKTDRSAPSDKPTTVKGSPGSLTHSTNWPDTAGFGKGKTRGPYVRDGIKARGGNKATSEYANTAVEGRYDTPDQSGQGFLRHMNDNPHQSSNYAKARALSAPARAAPAKPQMSVDKRRLQQSIGATGAKPVKQTAWNQPSSKSQHSGVGPDGKLIPRAPAGASALAGKSQYSGVGSDGKLIPRGGAAPSTGGAKKAVSAKKAVGGLAGLSIKAGQGYNALASQVNTRHGSKLTGAQLRKRMGGQNLHAGRSYSFDKAQLGGTGSLAGAGGYKGKALAKQQARGLAVRKGRLARRAGQAAKQVAATTQAPVAAKPVVKAAPTRAAPTQAAAAPAIPMHRLNRSGQVKRLAQQMRNKPSVSPQGNPSPSAMSSSAWKSRIRAASNTPAVTPKSVSPQGATQLAAKPQARPAIPAAPAGRRHQQVVKPQAAAKYAPLSKRYIKALRTARAGDPEYRT